ncbi:hypothetical protein N0V88_007682 [Collariella sp. IMI 366227]|nr:hypothetical protein N0V88_007682 [Collariella sp. IMI 366227]
MEPYAHSAEDLDDMVSKLSRLNTRRSNLSHRTPSLSSSFDERYDGRRRIPSGGVPMPRTPDSPQYLARDDAFRLPIYELEQLPGTMAPMPKFHRKDSYASERRPSRGSSAAYSLYPAPNPPLTKPLPPIPTNRKNSLRVSSQPSLDRSDVGPGDTSRYSQSSRDSTLERVSSCGSATPSSPINPGPPLSELSAWPQPPMQPMQPQHGASLVNLVPWKQLMPSNDKPLKEPCVYYFDISTTSATLASKHGNNMIRIWSVGSGEVQSTLKISCYTNAQPRSREYFVRSHAILSEPSNMVAIATGFGDTLEIWDWGRKKRLQTIDHANRWAAVRSNVMESGWCPLVTYRSDADKIDLYAASNQHHSKKPFKKSRTIDLRKANLPRETLLVAWEIQDGAPTTPYKIVAPWQHTEIDTALPSGLATYGSVAVSIWIPASYRAIPIPTERGGGGYNLAPVPVLYRHVLVWDFSVNSTKTFRIPNAMSCVSPDCRFIAYCDAAGTENGARGSMALLDAMTGRRLWCWPDPYAGLAERYAD